MRRLTHNDTEISDNGSQPDRHGWNKSAPKAVAHAITKVSHTHWTVQDGWRVVRIPKKPGDRDAPWTRSLWDYGSRCYYVTLAAAEKFIADTGWMKEHGAEVRRRVDYADADTFRRVADVIGYDPKEATRV